VDSWQVFGFSNASIKLEEIYFYVFLREAEKKRNHHGFDFI